MLRCLLALLALMSACAPTPPSMSLPLTESFDSPDGWTLAHNSQADITVGGGQLLITVNQPDSLAWSVLAGKTFDDFVLDVEATPISGPDDNDYGVILRRVDDDDFYRFEISGDGYYNVQKRYKDVWEKLVPDWTASEAIRKGKAANHLRVVCVGHTMTFYVNQIQLVQVTDASFTRGEVGLLAGTLAQPGVQVAFDNLRLGR